MKKAVTLWGLVSVVIVLGFQNCAPSRSQRAVSSYNEVTGGENYQKIALAKELEELKEEGPKEGSMLAERYLPVPESERSAQEMEPPEKCIASENLEVQSGPMGAQTASCPSNPREQCLVICHRSFDDSGPDQTVLASTAEEVRSLMAQGDTMGACEIDPVSQGDETTYEEIEQKPSQVCEM